jgi:hypothetical protein
VDVDLWQYTTGFTNGHPIYSVSALRNGVVTLTKWHIAHFVPSAGFSGLGAVRFSVTASDGTGLHQCRCRSDVTRHTASNLIWQGDGAANLWANGSGSNWLKGDALVTFSSGDNVTFDDTVLTRRRSISRAHWAQVRFTSTCRTGLHVWWQRLSFGGTRCSKPEMARYF